MAKPQKPSHRDQHETLDKIALVTALAMLGLGMTFLLAMMFPLFPERIRLRAFAIETSTPPAQIVTRSQPSAQAVVLRPLAAVDIAVQYIQPSPGRGHQPLAQDNSDLPSEKLAYRQVPQPVRDMGPGHETKSSGGSGKGAAPKLGAGD